MQHAKNGPTKFGALFLVLMATAALLGMTAGGALAADNTATGDISGVGGDLDNSNTFSLTSSTLALVKTAFLTDGTELTSGVSLPKGTNVRFMIYIDNTTGVPVTDVNVQDILDPLFAFQTGTIKVDNSVATGGTNAAIYAAVNGAAALTDALDGDVAGISGATVSAGLSAGNAQLDIAASMVWAMLVEVEIQ